MESVKLLTIVGGISAGSLNKRYYEALKNLHPNGFEFVDFDIASLPYFSQDLENDPPDVVIKFKEAIREADAVLFITPEYNRSFPGVLKNALDWGSRPYGMSVWEKKPAAILGVSPGNIGTFGAQHHLRQVLSYLDMPTVNQPEVYLKAQGIFDGSGNIESSELRALLTSFFEALRILTEKTIGKAILPMGALKSQELSDSSAVH